MALVGFLAGLKITAREALNKPKSYKQYQADAEAHNASIMRKYGAPEGARPPRDKDFLPASSDRQYRRSSFLKRRSLEPWPTREGKYS